MAVRYVLTLKFFEFLKNCVTLFDIKIVWHYFDVIFFVAPPGVITKKYKFSVTLFWFEFEYTIWQICCVALFGVKPISGSYQIMHRLSWNNRHQYLTPMYCYLLVQDNQWIFQKSGVINIMWKWINLMIGYFLGLKIMIGARFLMKCAK